MNEIVSKDAKSHRDDTLLTADFNLRAGNAASSYGLTILRSYSLPLLTPYFPNRTTSVTNTNNTPRKPYFVNTLYAGNEIARRALTSVDDEMYTPKVNTNTKRVEPKKIINNQLEPRDVQVNRF
jgi:hypothetical protein